MKWLTVFIRNIKKIQLYFRLLVGLHNIFRVLCKDILWKRVCCECPNTVMNLHYTKTTVINDKDSTYNSTQTLMAVTPEITTGNHIKLEIDAEIKNEISSGKVYLPSPGRVKCFDSLSNA